MAFTPAHQFVAAEPESPRKMIFTSGQAVRICATIIRISVKLPNEASWLASLKRAENVFSTEHVQRQIAVTVVIAVKEPAFLMPVQRIVGRVEIEDDLLGWRSVRL